MRVHPTLDFWSHPLAQVPGCGPRGQVPLFAPGLGSESPRPLPFSTAPFRTYGEPQNEENRLERQPGPLEGAQNSFEPTQLKAGLRVKESRTALGWDWPEKSPRGHDGQELRGMLPNKHRPLGEPSPCARTLPPNLAGQCSRSEGKVKEPSGEEMASQRLLAGERA